MTVCSLNYQSQVFSGSGSTSTGIVHIESHLAEKVSPMCRSRLMRAEAVENTPCGV